MKIMTFNTQHCLNYLEQKIDFPIMARVIAESGADIIGLNEMRDRGKGRDYTDQTKALSELSGIPNYYFARAINMIGGGPYGNAFLSKIPIVKAQTILVPDPKIKIGKYMFETRCLLKAELENGLTVLVIHFGLNKSEQKKAVETVLKNTPKEKCVLMGDFNVTPDNEVLEPLREIFKDTAEFIKGDAFTFPSDKPNRKIDYIFVTKDIKVEASAVLPTVASDHRPVTADISEY